MRSINLFLAHQTFRDTMGGSARRGILFEGPPGTGKTFVAKAMAKEANVPFLFVSASAFQSMYYGQTNRKIRSFFKQLRKHAHREGGAIGFIEEIDAIGAIAARHGRQRRHRGRLRRGQRAAGAAAVLRPADPGAALRLGLDRRSSTATCPTRAKLHKPAVVPANVLVVGATNRKDDLDPALIRPGASTARSTSVCPAGGPGPTSSPTTWARRRTRPTSTSTAPSTSWPA